ncbi:hypothetical protein BCR34DRAFT_540591 [Clohesyomyces aquaticus]|uniref:DUF6594 domain-containing protein n=1 Tax=Clohesyomyces aquaticus TaxID=1231657 RepID=A0A1Y1ZH96_9PLEO|nr:hypothetical protein BCR34DRAFT_540591 [Clohesyomyces aquaticus]
MDAEASSKLPVGYPSLAAFIASDPDQTAAIFRRFNRLAARNLLHLQSELAELESKQDQLDEEECHGGLERKQYSRNWPDFCHAALTDSRQQERKVLAEEIRTVLKEYRTALFLESHVASLHAPSKRTFLAFKYQFFNGSLQSTDCPTLGARSACILDDLDDLLTLHIPEDHDRLTAFVQNHLSWIFRTRPSNGNIAYSSDRRIARFVALLSTIIAAGLLIGAIVSLYSVSSPRKKLGIIAAFTTLFAANVGLLTNARRAELFAASAGYAAVLVVFVSGNLGVGVNASPGSP